MPPFLNSTHSTINLSNIHTITYSYHDRHPQKNRAARISVSKIPMPVDASNVFPTGFPRFLLDEETSCEEEIDSGSEKKPRGLPDKSLSSGAAGGGDWC